MSAIGILNDAQNLPVILQREVHRELSTDWVDTTRLKYEAGSSSITDREVPYIFHVINKLLKNKEKIIMRFTHSYI